MHPQPQQHQQQQLGPCWRSAPQPDIVRAAQKDELYLQQSIDACHDAVMRTLGPITALQHAKSCRVLATFMYYATTTAAGLQTLGEEYCDIMQISQQPSSSSSSSAAHASTQGLAPVHVRVLLTLLQSLGPAVLSRLVSSLDRASEQGRLQLELAGFESLADDMQFSSLADEASYTWQQREQEQRTGQTPSSSSTWAQLQQLRHNVCNTCHKVQQQLAPHWPSLKGWLLFAGRLHLAAFYLHGHYYEWSKRLLRVRFTSISPNKEDRGSYRFLGLLLLVQLVISGLMQARSQLDAAVTQPSGSTHLDQAAHSSQQKHAVLLPDPVAAAPEQHLAAGARAVATPGAPAVSSSGGASVAGKQCPLCLSVRQHATCTPCGHVFCWQCIAQWCLEKPECPLCRTEVTAPQLVCLYHADL